MYEYNLRNPKIKKGRKKLPSIEMNNKQILKRIIKVWEQMPEPKNEHSVFYVSFKVIHKNIFEKYPEKLNYFWDKHKIDIKKLSNSYHVIITYQNIQYYRDLIKDM